MLKEKLLIIYNFLSQILGKCNGGVLHWIEVPNYENNSLRLSIRRMADGGKGFDIAISVL